MDHLIEPHGGELQELLVDDERARELHAASIEFPSIDLNDRQLCDLELLMAGGFSPLTGFLGQADYDAVLDKCRLADGTVWPMPITLDVSESVAAGLEVGQSVALRDPEGFMLGVLHLDEVYRPDKAREAAAVFGTTDRHHPGVAYLMDSAGDVYLAGRVEGVQLPLHFDFTELRLTPAETREEFARLGWRRVVASPLPQEIMELKAIKALIKSGTITITVGGGGIPVIATDQGLKGTAAVIDKDFASAFLAKEIEADLLLISTAVEKVALNFGKPDQEWIDEMTVAEAKQYLKEGTHFAKGSMEPKIKAIVRFLEDGGKKAIVTNPENIGRALKGETGTHIVP